ncbi:hypothetical protein ABZP36_034827, partial [Zizania latifolia]
TQKSGASRMQRQNSAYVDARRPRRPAVHTIVILAVHIVIVLAARRRRSPAACHHPSSRAPSSLVLPPRAVLSRPARQASVVLPPSSVVRRPAHCIPSTGAFFATPPGRRAEQNVGGPRSQAATTPRRQDTAPDRTQGGHATPNRPPGRRAGQNARGPRRTERDSDRHREVQEGRADEIRVESMPPILGLSNLEVPPA